MLASTRTYVDIDKERNSIKWSWSGEESEKLYLKQDTGANTVWRESDAGRKEGDNGKVKFIIQDRSELPCLDASTYIVYFPGTNEGSKQDKVVIPAEQVQEEAGDSKHLSKSGDCGIGKATKKGNYYEFTLSHKAGVLVFAPYASKNYVGTEKITSITFEADEVSNGTYTLPTAPEGKLGGSVADGKTKTTLSIKNGISVSEQLKDYSNAGFMVLYPGIYNNVKITYNVTNGDETYSYVKEQDKITIGEESVKPILTDIGTLSRRYTEADLKNKIHTFQLVFHLLRRSDDWNNAGKLSGITTAFMENIINKVNDIYGGRKAHTRNSGIRFELAKVEDTGKHFDSGKQGIVTYMISSSYLSIDDCLDDTPGGQWHNMCWDRTKYINIFIYPIGSGFNGITYNPGIPEAVAKNGDYSVYGSSNLYSKNYSILINTTYFIDLLAGKKLDNNAHPACTIAHELGHYLGLGHVFEEDYCNDTQRYNRTNYTNEYRTYPDSNSRKGLDGSLFISTNIMDYWDSHRNQFTKDQIERMRRYAIYGSFVPGPKVYLEGFNAKSRASRVSSIESEKKIFANKEQ